MRVILCMTTVFSLVNSYVNSIEEDKNKIISLKNINIFKPSYSQMLVIYLLLNLSRCYPDKRLLVLLIPDQYL